MAYSSRPRLGRPPLTIELLFRVNPPHSAPLRANQVLLLKAGGEDWWNRWLPPVKHQKARDMAAIAALTKESQGSIERYII